MAKKKLKITNIDEAISILQQMKSEGKSIQIQIEEDRPPKPR